MFKRIGKALTDVKDVATDAANTVANGATTGAASFTNAATALMVATKDQTVSIANGTVQGTLDAIEAIDSSAKDAIGFTGGMIGGAVAGVDNKVQGTRNFAADMVSGTGKVVGFGGGLAGEVTLIIATAPLCCVPYLFVGGKSMELGQLLADSTSELSQSIRGSRPNFVGIQHEPGFFYSDMTAIIYDVNNPKKNKDGYVYLSERDLNAHRRTDDEGYKTLYETAFFAIQDAKLKNNISLDCAPLDLKAEAKEERIQRIAERMHEIKGIPKP